MGAAREEFKMVDVGGRSFKIKKFDALTGSYIAYQLMSHLLPIMSKGKGDIQALLSSGIPIMPRDTFLELQKDCINVCSEVTVLNGVPVDLPLMMADGRWAVDGLATDTVTVMTLTIQTLVFNVSSFFDKMGSLFPGMPDPMKDQISSISKSFGEDMPTPQ